MTTQSAAASTNSLRKERFAQGFRTQGLPAFFFGHNSPPAVQVPALEQTKPEREGPQSLRLCSGCSAARVHGKRRRRATASPRQMRCDSMAEALSLLSSESALRVGVEHGQPRAGHTPAHAPSTSRQPRRGWVENGGGRQGRRRSEVRAGGVHVGGVGWKSALADLAKENLFESTQAPRTKLTHLGSLRGNGLLIVQGNWWAYRGLLRGPWSSGNGESMSTHLGRKFDRLAGPARPLGAFRRANRRRCCWHIDMLFSPESARHTILCTHSRFHLLSRCSARGYRQEILSLQ